MDKFQENIVPASNQNKKTIILDADKGGIKVLFVGNSITKHSPKPEIGWTRDCGMAASCLEKDYVHIMEQSILAVHPDASFGILQIADFERGFDKMDIEESYESVHNFNADIILMFFGANVSSDYIANSNPEVTFGEKYEQLRNYLKASDSAKVIHSQGFYIKPTLDAEKKLVAEKYGDVFINIEDIRTLPETHGEFNHPNDLGMKMLAERFLENISL